MLLRCRQELIICFVSKPRLGQDEQPRPGKGQGLVHSDLVKRSPLDDGSPWKPGKVSRLLINQPLGAVTESFRLTHPGNIRIRFRT